MNYGKHFKKIRVEKKLTIAEVAKDIMSISLLSKFERGLCEITINKFTKILEQVGVTLSEFEMIVNNFEKSSINQLLDSLKEYYSKKQLNEVDNIINNEFTLWKKSNNIRHRYNYTMLSIINDDLRNISVTPEKDIEVLTDYLFSIEDWTYYELILYGNSLSAIKLDALILLSNELIGKTSYFKNNSNHRKMVIQTLLNTIIVCLEKNKLEESLIFQKEVTQLINSDTLLYEKNILLYCEGLYQYKIDNYDEGQKKIEMAITIFSQLGSVNLASNYSEHFNSIKID